jgi:hypothetical protein
MNTTAIDSATLRAGAREANRLNRLYSKDFRAYQRAIHGIKTKYELRREAKERELSLQTSSTKPLSVEEIAYRDKQHKAFDPQILKDSSHCSTIVIRGQYTNAP